ncbi:MAG TPA: arginyltransferase [Arenimonas sp.]|nr:arginyltransferase [Arenimonas sp.]
MGTQSGIRLFQTLEHRCGYYPERQARDLILDPDDPRLQALYGEALARGYRRSGGHVYRPHCRSCQACVPVRIPVQRFVPDRSQRRCLKRNHDLDLVVAPAKRSDEHFDLFRRYLRARHAGGGMDDASEDNFDAFLSCPWSPTVFLELRRQGELLAVAVTDVVPGALSAVYTFFDPDQRERGLGSLAILQQIAWAQAQRRHHLYLGFWIAGHPKMDYKQRYQPLQRLDGEFWVDCAPP